MRDAIRAVQEVIEEPVSIDSYTVDVLIAGLEVAEGRPIVNSVPFEKEYMDELLPAVAEARGRHDRNVHEGRPPPCRRPPPSEWRTRAR